MTQAITTIRLSLPYHLGSVNCYLMKTGTGYLLIDTGGLNQRAVLDKELERAGCAPGSLALIILTHGDFDHTGNATYLRAKYGTNIAMHPDDAGMLERGDMFWNRKRSHPLVGLFAPLLFGFPKSNRSHPDLYLEEGDDLSRYGFEAKVLALPGHSKGSIAILTAGGDLFCGDLLTNIDKPALNGIIDDAAAANASVARLKSLNIETIYPGHGKPFPMDLFLRTSEIVGRSA
jgi:hydroxyacylglutathione hydrolase